MLMLKKFEVNEPSGIERAKLHSDFELSTTP